MLKKYGFYIILIVIYLLFLVKDNLFSFFDTQNIESTYNNNLESYYEKEYKELTKALNISTTDYNFIYTKVIIRDLYEFFDKIVIEKGSSDNLTKGDLVINEYGLVGIVNKVNKNSSEVSLLTNSNTNLSVKIGSSYGILTAHDSKLYVKNIKTNSKINIGDKVYTSGLTNTLENILIGEVTNITKDNLELEYILEVKSPANFYNIKYLGVITS